MIRLGELASLIGAAVIPPAGDPLPVPRPHGRGDAADGDCGTLELLDIEHDSRRVRPGAVFACIPGTRADGHDHACDAVGAGARALLVERRLSRTPVPQLLVDSVRRALGVSAGAVHGHPSGKLDLIGVTGTNGKTTTVRLIAELLSAAGAGVCEIGTLTGDLTTPEAPDLQRLLVGADARGDSHAVMEVSSHALSQHRVDGCLFRVAVFTNLGHDHLDYHGSVESYFEAKARLFEPGMTDRAVINSATPAGRRLADMVGIRIPVTLVGEHSAEPIRVGLRSSLFAWRGQRVRLPLGGAFNIANAVTAAETALLLGVTPRLAADALAEVPVVPGRFEPVGIGGDRMASDLPNSRDSRGGSGPAGGTASSVGGFEVIVDYAHTPEGIEHVLGAARSVTDGRLTVVFGAGGDRDRRKRPSMGRVASECADRVVLTSDNPRSEDPMRIIDEIISGMGSPPDSVEPDRRLAVRSALAAARPGDVIVIAGKGHESVQVTGSGEREFDDRRVVREELSLMAARRSASGSAGGAGA